MLDRSLIAHQTTRSRPDRPAPAGARDRLRAEDAELLRRIHHLRKALEGLTRDNAELRRTLAQLKLENRALKEAARLPVSASNREAHLHAMLRDPCSRNP
jgi:hypothetical protein